LDVLVLEDRLDLYLGHVSFGCLPGQPQFQTRTLSGFGARVKARETRTDDQTYAGDVARRPQRGRAPAARRRCSDSTSFRSSLARAGGSIAQSSVSWRCATFAAIVPRIRATASVTVAETSKNDPIPIPTQTHIGISRLSMPQRLFPDTVLDAGRNSQT
jgi:hypothetical protein